MFKGEKVVAIVPARGGSKRFPGKNVFPLCGQPLIVWTLQSARDAKNVDEVRISTDSAAIASVCESHGFPVSSLRPSSLAADSTTTAETILHEISAREDVAWVLLLQPTSPLRTCVDIDVAFEALARAEADRLVSVRKLAEKPAWIHAVGPTGALHRAFSKTPEALYVPNGAIYIARRTDLLAGYAFEAHEALPYEMTAQASIDIDTVQDMAKAERWMETRRTHY